MKILLTGATGFLGSSLLTHLVNEGQDVVIILRPASDTWRIAHLLDRVSVFHLGDELLPVVFDHHRIDTIVHCATNYGRKQVDPISLLEANLIFPLQLMHYGNSAGVRCFVNTDTVLDKRVNHYSLSKSQFKGWLHHYADTMTCVNVALEHFFGPLDDPTKFVTFIIQKLLSGENSIDLTAGEQKRDFIYIDDVVSAFLLILEHALGLAHGYFEYEIGTGSTISIRSFVKMVKELCGNQQTVLNFGAIPYRANEVMETAVNIDAIRSLGWSPQYSLTEGLRKTILLERGSS